MKRSEMIEEIATSLILHELNRGSDLSFDRAQELAEVALKTAEKNKMACWLHNEYDSIDDFGIVIPVYEWELE
jgi:hypothetical protein